MEKVRCTQLQRQSSIQTSHVDTLGVRIAPTEAIMMEASIT